MKIAGVDVGSVKSVGLTDDNLAELKFTVDRKFRCPSPSRRSSATRTSPATGTWSCAAAPATRVRSWRGDVADVADRAGAGPDKLLGGFKPLFRTLDGAQVNELSNSLIQVFQGDEMGPAINHPAYHRELPSRWPIGTR